LTSSAPRFDPKEWTGIHAQAGRSAPGYVFRRGLELTRDACLAQSRAGDVWVDSGCGKGQLANALEQGGRRTVRLDLDPAMLREHSGVCADGRLLPLPSASVHGVAAVSFLGCLERPEEFFAEASRVLKPQGILVCTHTNRGSLLLMASRALGSNDVGQPLSGRVASHGARSVRIALAAAGFEVVEHRVYSFVLDLGSGCVPESSLARRLEVIGRRGRAACHGRNTLLVARVPPER
jgi:SAM-dependent methyltransferase